MSVATFSRWLKDLFSRAEEESCRSYRVGFSHRLQASATIESMSEPLTFLVFRVHSQALDSGQKESATTIYDIASHLAAKEKDIPLKVETKAELNIKLHWAWTRFCAMNKGCIRKDLHRVCPLISLWQAGK